MDTQAEEAANLYCSIFPNSKILKTTYYPEAAEAVSGKKAGTVLTVEFELEGNPFVILNGGPDFKLNESVSFSVPCETQEEIDHYWNSLTADGGQESQCGWLKDKFGVSWQIVPAKIGEWLEKNPEKVMAAFLPMQKLDMAAIEAAANS